MPVNINPGQAVCWFFINRCEILSNQPKPLHGRVIMSEQAQTGDTVRVHYTGRLADGQIFDSSEGGEPLEFKIGAGQVIEGFDEGVREMSIGGEKKGGIANGPGLSQPKKAPLP